MSVRQIACVGDRFIGGGLLADALRNALDERGLAGWSLTETSSDWPDTPFGDGAGIREWAGDLDQVRATVAGSAVIVTHLGPVNADVMDAAGPGLRLVAVTRGGPVNVDLAAATARGVPVGFLPGRNLEAVAEFTVGVMIAGPRNIELSSRRMHGGEEWSGDLFAFGRCGSELRGATVGLVGFGEVGGRVATLLRAFGATVLAFDPFADPSRVAALGVEAVSLEELLERSGFISLHARLTDETRNMIGAAELARMRPGTYLVNTARGELVDEVALADALDAGRLSGAALDVFHPEPPSLSSPLRDRGNVVLTSHLAGSSQQVASGSAVRIADAVAGYLADGRLEHCANPAALDGGTGAA